MLLLGGRRTDKWGHWLAVALSWASFVWGALLFLNILGLPTAERAVRPQLFDWIPAGNFQLDAGLLLDPLSVTFVLLVTFVGSLILVYAVAYMEHDHDRRRFFAYLDLFVASMLLLVLADSYLLLYVGWEGVGLASYLLIGFWNYNPDYATAAKKAFVMNRVGDFGLSIAIMIMFAGFGSVAYSVVLPNAGKASEGLLTAIGLMLLLGACGKSAQFPLQSWLGDAMAGPTPVSALIHAATMVTAGVYLVVRSGPIYEGAPDAALVVVIVGAITLLFGAIVGCAKDDIKKALAASTMSQIGYMMLAAGLGPIGYVYGILHLLTHGFFKAGMFLGAGSVMHGMNDSVDMRRFGGLWSAMRITAITFGAGWLAIIGFPFLSGFWSKDKIIETAFATGERLAPVGVRPGGTARRRDHRVLHVPVVLHDLPQPPTLGRRRPPARVAPAHDGAHDHPGARIALPRRPAARPRRASRTGSSLRPAPARRASRSSPRRSCPSSPLSSSRSESPSRGGCTRVPRTGGRPTGIAGDPLRAPRPLPGRRQRGRVHATRPVPDALARLRRRPGRRRRRPRGRGLHRRACRALAPLADRVRPLLRDVDAGRRDRAGSRRARRPALRGNHHLMDVPWLTIIGLLPTVGALVAWGSLVGGSAGDGAAETGDAVADESKASFARWTAWSPRSRRSR